MKCRKWLAAVFAVAIVVSGAWAQGLPDAEKRLAAAEKEHGRESEEVAAILNYLASIHAQEGRYALGEAIYRRALAIWEKIHGPLHSRVSGTLEGIAEIYAAQGMMDRVKPLYERIEGIWRQTEEPCWIVMHMNEKAGHASFGLGLRKDEKVGRDADFAEYLYGRALAIGEELLGPDHSRLADSHAGLADVLENTGRIAPAEVHYKRALAIKEKNLGKDHIELVKLLERMAGFYRFDKKSAVEAKACYLLSLEIREKAFAPQGKEIATLLSMCAENYCPEPVIGHLKNARQLEEGGRYMDALLALGEALKGIDPYPWNPDPDSMEIRRAMAQVLKRMPVEPPLPEEARKHVVEADVWIAKADLSNAQNSYEQAIRIAPYVPSLYYNYSMILAKRFSGDDKALYLADTAIESLEAYLDLSPEAPDAREAKDQVYKWELMKKR
jgi:tetratricopeptide (TPR) repeat protein